MTLKTGFVAQGHTFAEMYGVIIIKQETPRQQLIH